jgi:hypothetical protein
MGWQAFPDEVTDNKARAEMLDETIDILTLLYQRQQFDYDGQHYQLKLTLMDVMHYPPKPVQQPRIPIWIPGHWPHEKSMHRTLKCDGLIIEKLGSEALEPDDVRQIKAYVQANRKLTTPFDIVISGKTKGLDDAQREARIRPFMEAGATWWVEEFIGDSEETILEHIRRRPPQVE